MTSAFQIVHSCVRTAVPAASLSCPPAVHVGQHGNLRNPQTVNDDMHGYFRVAVSVRVEVQTRAWCPEMPAQNFSQFLPDQRSSRCPGVPWVKLMMCGGSLRPPFLVLAVAEIGAHTGNGKSSRHNSERICGSLHLGMVARLRQGGLHEKLVMLECEVFFSVPVVGIFVS